MSNRRKLRPHELARRDQLLAEAKARLRRGEVVIWSDPAPPGWRCSYCDCPITPDSPHWQPGYVCDHPCPAGADFIVVVLSHPRPSPIPLCARHQRDWRSDFTDLVRHAAHVDVIGPWMDPD
jgi:hypothetical protein